MSDSPEKIDRVLELAEAVCTKDATEDDFAELDELLRDDPKSRNGFLDYCWMHASLRLQLRTHRLVRNLHDEIDNELRQVSAAQFRQDASPPSASTPAIFAPSLQRVSNDFLLGWPAAYLVATVVVGLGLTIAAFTHVSQQVQVAMEPSPTTPISPPSSKALIVGHVTGMVDCVFEGSGFRGQGAHGDQGRLNPRGQSSAVCGQNVRLGDSFALRSGLLEIKYHTGAKVILQGPVRYEIESAAGGFLAIGKLTARLGEKVEGRGDSDVQQQSGKGPESSHSPLATHHSLSPLPSPLFTISTPTAIVTDLGTEFGVDVDKAGQTETHVFSGEVVAAVAGQSGQMARSIHLKAGETTTITKNALSLTVLRTAPDNVKKFVRTLPGAPVVLFQEDAGGPTRFSRSGNRDWPKNSWKLGGARNLLVLGAAYSSGRSSLASLATNGRCWSVLPNTSAVRDFGFDLPIGAAFFIELDPGKTLKGHSMGFALCDAAEQSRFEFAIEDGRDTYSIHDQLGTATRAGIPSRDTHIPVTDRGLRLALQRDGVDSYRLVVLRFEDRDKFAITGRFMTTPSGTAIRRLRVWNDVPADPNNPMEPALYFNRIRIVGPLPGTQDAIQGDRK